MAGAPARDRLAIVRRAHTRRFLAMRPFPALHGGPLLGLDSTQKPSVKQAFYPSQRRGRDSNPRWTNQAHNGFRDDRLGGSLLSRCRLFVFSCPPRAIVL